MAQPQTIKFPVRSSARITVEHHVPMPALKSARQTYPWDEMSIGSSFLIPAEQKSRTSVATAATHAARKRGWVFTCRKVDGGTRVWRTA